MRKENLAFIDLELTGLSPLKHEIIELGVVIASPALRVIEEFEFKIKPENLESADPVSLKVSNYNEEDWRGAVPLREALEILNAKTEGCLMVAHNVAFDFLFLETAFARLGMKSAMHYHKLDTMSIAWAKLHREPIEHFSLRELCERFSVENPRAHTALSDARATYELYKKLLAI